MRTETAEKVWSLLNTFKLAKYELVTVPELAHESDNFVLIEYKGQSVWLPKSKIDIERKKDSVRLRVPAWLQKKMDRMAR